MKANELMIGDWVMLTNRIHNGEKMQVKEIHGDGHITVDGAITKMFEPIQLTAEILEKNGFEECRIDEIEYIGWRLNEDFSLELNAVDTLIWNDDVTIHYVHELQHALRLCNIEKTIEL